MPYLVPSPGEAERGIARRRARLGLTEPQLRTGQRIDELGISTLGDVWPRFWRELAVLATLVEETEQVCDIVYAHLMFHAGLLLLTDRRLAYVWFRMFRPGWGFKTFELDTITRIEIDDRHKFGRLRTHFGRGFWGERWKEFNRMEPAEIQRFGQALAAQLENARAHNRPA